MDELLYAGFLCATHVGENVRINDVEGVIYQIRYLADRATVFVVIHSRGDQRDDGSVRKVAHVMKLDPRAVVALIP